MKIWKCENGRVSRLMTLVMAALGICILAYFYTSTFACYGEASQVAVANRCTSLKVNGETKLTGAGGVILSSLSIPADAKLVLDPIATPIYASSTPRFGTGAKIALSSDYAKMKLGRIVLMTYSGSATFSQSLFDITSVAGSAALSEATAPDGTNKQLVLTVGDYEHKARDIRRRI